MSASALQPRTRPPAQPARFRTAAAAVGPDERCCANCTAFHDATRTCRRAPPVVVQVGLAEFPVIRQEQLLWCRDGFEARRNGKGTA